MDPRPGFLNRSRLRFEAAQMGPRISQHLGIVAVATFRCRIVNYSSHAREGKLERRFREEAFSPLELAG